PVVLRDRLTGKLAPKKVIPFQISKAQAQEAFVKWCRRGILTPPGFMTANRIKNITGMYVPFWMYDLNSHVKFRGNGTKVRTYTRVIIFIQKQNIMMSTGILICIMSGFRLTHQKK